MPDSTPPLATLKTAKKAKKAAFLTSEKIQWHLLVTPKRKRTETFCEAKLVHHNYNMSKKWWVTFWALDVSTGKKTRKRISGALNQLDDLEDRKELGKAMVEQFNRELNEGKLLGRKKPEQWSAVFKRMTLTELITWYIDAKKVNNNSVEYYRKYQSVIFNLSAWFKHEGINNLMASNFNHDAALIFFEFLKRERKLGNKTINNYRSQLGTIFNYIIKMKPGVYKVNPVANIPVLPTYTKKHAAFSDQQLKQIHEHAKKKYAHTQFLLFVQCMYYLLARPKELRYLRIKDFDLELNRVLFRAEISKNRRDEYVYLPPALKEIIKAQKLETLPAEHFLFSRDNKPGRVAVGKNYFGDINAAVLEALQFNDKEYTIYGYKHSGAISLYIATKDIKLVQAQCRHANS
ncbi:MAG: tyrosine-type recombinase/integrase, partial [Pseudomonadota bacterium]